MAVASEVHKFNRWSAAQRAEFYTKFRPPYQQVTVPWLLEYYRRKHPSSTGHKIPLAIDVACGSGQLSGQLATACDRVIGIDISQAMLDAAQRYNNHPNVEYRLGCVQDLTELCAGEKPDILVVGMAIHFFDNDEFYSSVKALLKPGGVFAVFGYLAGGVKIDNRPDLESFMLEYLEDQMLDQSFFRAISTLKQNYAEIRLPFAGEERRSSRELFPSNREAIRGLLLSNPLDVLKDGEEGVKRTVEKVPAEGTFAMICDVFGILAQL